ncbi:hypothetical protein [Streptomyces sp. cg35]|uniref:hypothetical protein n=1 Tax=Streptomyces sp. cg35 TaxID=3421650 RepID=UPI003D17CC4D
MITVSVALLLAVIAFMLLRRPVGPRKRGDTFFTMLVALVLGVLIAPTALGQGITDVMSQLANAISQIGQ